VSQLKENLDHIPKLDDMTMQNIKLVFKDHPIPF
jgi:hypothetical protein